MSKKFYITTAIDYVNGKPHLGHAYEKVLADVIARFHRAQGEAVHFLTGVDEHGQKVQQSAQKHGVEPQAFCDEMSAHFVTLCRSLDISNDDFVRTTQPRHKKVVQDILQKLFDEGHIYKGKFEGFYSTRQEQFVTEKERLPDGNFPEIYGEVIALTEENYYFRLGSHQQWLIDFVEKNPGFICPEFRRKEVLGFLQKPLGDLCISRPKARLSWGIPFPFDPEYVTYVWFDALINYVSVVGYGTTESGSYWPADHHVIGKDIMIPAHAIYWPIMLQAIGLPQPRQLLVHGWWTMDREKMSKSLGNIVDPLEYASKYGVDAFRYFLMREMVVGYDSDFSHEGFVTRFNSDLANDLGNLLNRSLNMIKRYRQGLIPAPVEKDENDKSLDALGGEILPEVIRCFSENKTHEALSLLWQLVQRTNQYIEQSAPWALAKDPAKAAKLDTVLYNLAESLRLVSVLVAPVMPTVASKIQDQLGLREKQVLFPQFARWGLLPPGQPIGEAQPLFPRIESDDKKARA
ncbi:MAG: methionine--tRNA ligase [Verrucomicrobiae bacterium]|nr:methionine--tRNA ligase [Verrucomicrobiae bacterium]